MRLLRLIRGGADVTVEPLVLDAPTSPAYQLTLDGREVEYPLRAPRVSRPLTALQEDIVAFARLRNGWIRPVEAGRLAHDHRYAAGRYADRSYACGFGAKGGHRDSRAVGCCPYASADGAAALKRLEARGLVVKLAPGMWTLTEFLERSTA